MDNFIVGLQKLRAAGATDIYPGHDEIWVCGAGVEAAVEEYGFYWEQPEHLDEGFWVYYT
jgi:glyoxylase-like metal-dependent hydrolase (beta-lactamase superfamily II)